ncbi:hypothetical protein HDU93_010081 [Gonapodya sp. JEL0774]|nr:hypothetical protein HDU93_010081 [Gonapodya sp. JEL0774]
MRVIVVGSGIFGLSSACALQSEGHSVLVLERSETIPAKDASSTDISKVVRLDYGNDRLYARLALRAIEKFRVWNTEAVDCGKQPLFHETGVVCLSTRRLEDTDFERNSLLGIKELGLLGSVERLNREQVVGDGELFKAGQILKPNPVEKRFPTWGNSPANIKYVDGYYNKIGGYALSSKVVERMAETARSMGVKFVCGKAGAVKSIVKGPQGKATGVVAVDGTKHEGDLIVLACGAWTPSLVPELDGKLVATGQSVIHFQLPPNLAPKYSGDKFPVWFADISTTGYYGFPLNPSTPNLLKISNHGPGCVNPVPLSPTRTVSVPRTSVTDAGLTIPLQTLLEYRTFVDAAFPELAGMRIHETRLCWYTDAWDGHFYVDYVPGWGSSVMVATGGSGHAFKFAPVLDTIFLDVFHRRRTPYTDLFRWRERPDAGVRVLESTRAKTSLVTPLVMSEAQMADERHLAGVIKEKM